MEGKEDDDGRDGRGWMISWIDNSPEALRRQDALRQKERQDKGDEERELAAINEQIRRAKRDGLEEEEEEEDEETEEVKEIKRKDGEKIKLNFGAKKVDSAEKPTSPPLTDKGESSGEDKDGKQGSAEPTETRPSITSIEPKPTGISFGKPKAVESKNVFAQKKNVFSGPKKTVVATPQKPVSEAERIMKEELERKRLREANGGISFKRQRVS